MQGLYNYRHVLCNDDRWIAVAHTEPDQTECDIRGLQEGHEYLFRVKAVNAEGESEPLATDTAIKAKDPFRKEGRERSLNCVTASMPLILCRHRRTCILGTYVLVLIVYVLSFKGLALRIIVGLVSSRKKLFTLLSDSQIVRIRPKTCATLTGTWIAWTWNGTSRCATAALASPIT